MAAVTMRMPSRLRIGPGLERWRLPLGPTLLSAGSHAALFGLLVAAATLWHSPPSPVYVVNLVPSVAAVGRPEGVALPPRPDDRPVPRPTPSELPPRTAARELPAREAPRALPEREREPAALPERSLPPRAPGPPRASDKELPTPTRTAAAAAPVRPTPPAAEPRPAAAPPPPPVGSPTGAPQGSGAVTLNAGDFPYAWYIRKVHEKIRQRWEGRAMPGRQPAVIFEIARDGQLRGVTIDKSSGNAYYDRLAMAAVSDAGPFEPLPPEFPKGILTVGLQFGFDPVARQ